MINKLSPLPEFLIKRYKNWKSTSYLKDSVKFKKLASLGQNPNVMIISCCDSRIHVTSILGADEGEFFIHRNIANLIPPFSPDGEHHGTSAAIEYATKELKVSHLIILGHTGCGGIKSAHNYFTNKVNSNYVFINQWLSILLPAFNKTSKNISEKKQIESLEEKSIINSLENLYTFPNIKNAIQNNTISVHGLIHDIGSGGLKYLNPETKIFENI